MMGHSADQSQSLSTGSTITSAQPSRPRQPLHPEQRLGEQVPKHLRLRGGDLHGDRHRRRCLLHALHGVAREHLEPFEPLPLTVLGGGPRFLAGVWPSRFRRGTLRNAFATAFATALPPRLSLDRAREPVHCEVRFDWLRLRGETRRASHSSSA